MSLCQNRYLYKRGFAWRKAWVKRWVVLENREVSYFEKPPKGGEEPRGSCTLQRDLKVEAWGLSKTTATSLDFTLFPGEGAAPWEFRCTSAEEKDAWLRVFERCSLIASWLVQFQMGGLLGVGAAAVVREVRNRKSSEKFALKIVTIHDPRMRGVAMQEVELLQRVTESIRHRNLVTIKKVYQSADKLLIAMPLAKGGELYERIAALKRFTELDAAAAVYRVCDALAALHHAEPPILHLDVKPEVKRMGQS